jgi:hypothetical protein
MYAVNWTRGNIILLNSHQSEKWMLNKPTKYISIPFVLSCIPKLEVCTNWPSYGETLACVRCTLFWSPRHCENNYVETQTLATSNVSKYPTCNLHWLIGSHNIPGLYLCVDSTHDSQVHSHCWSIAGLWYLGGHTCIHLGRCILEHISHCVLMRTFG